MPGCPIRAQTPANPPTRRCVEAPPSGRAARFGDVVEALLGDVHLYLALLTAEAAPAEDLAAGTFEKAL